MFDFAKRPWVSWAFIGLLAGLCATLALLENHWIAEVSRAEKERLRQHLESELKHVSSDFNREITDACAALMPAPGEVDALGREQAYSSRYAQWKQTHERVFSRAAIAVPQDGSLELLNLDLETAQFMRTDWPASWAGVRGELLARMAGTFEPRAAESSNMVAIPRFGGPRFSPGHFRELGQAWRREQEWLVVELNLDYVRNKLLPELLHRYLAAGGGKLGYEARVVEASNPGKAIFESAGAHDGFKPDVSARIFDI